MSPAHARLASLASDMDSGHNSSSSSQDHDSGNLGPDPADYNVALDIPGAEAWQVSADELVAGSDSFAFGHGFDGGDDDNDNDDDDHSQRDGMWQPLSGLATLPGRSKERAAPIGGKWTSAEDNALKLIVQQHGPKNWKKVRA